MYIVLSIKSVSIRKLLQTRAKFKQVSYMYIDVNWPKRNPKFEEIEVLTNFGQMTVNIHRGQLT